MEYQITLIKGGTDNCYLVSKGKDAILVDTSSGQSLQMVLDECSKYNMKLLVLTHPHFDHAENADAISRQFQIPVAYHEADDEIFDNYDAQPLYSYGLVGFVVLKISLKVLRETKVVRPEDHFFVKEGDTFEEYGFPEVKVIELPGHTNGSIGLLVGEDSIIVGDALDNWITPGMGHLYNNKETQKKTFEKLRALGKRKTYYGHGNPTF
ncbi:MAG: MBL fold metallo-hydrolase [Lachnospiraceae bacterium]|nr:MBL fold metallo-hydrolase [Lachnospiraceae bacterium]